jgi:D-lactate dehydrogenase
VIQDDVFARLLTFPNVLVTAHQGFFTADALRAIARTTIENITAFDERRRTGNELVTTD